MYKTELYWRKQGEGYSENICSFCNFLLVSNYFKEKSHELQPPHLCSHLTTYVFQSPGPPLIIASASVSVQDFQKSRSQIRITHARDLLEEMPGKHKVRGRWCGESSTCQTVLTLVRGGKEGLGRKSLRLHTNQRKISSKP